MFAFIPETWYNYTRKEGKNMSDTIRNLLKEYVMGLSQILGPKLKRVILYGSYARGEQDKNGEISDIDLMILVDSSEEEMREFEKIINDYSYELDLKYNVLFSPIIESINNYNKRVKYIVFYKNVQKEGVTISV